MSGSALRWDRRHEHVPNLYPTAAGSRHLNPAHIDEIVFTNGLPAFRGVCKVVLMSFIKAKNDIKTASLHLRGCFVRGERSALLYQLAVIQLKRSVGFTGNL
jgi:hypothetical protein